MTKRTIENILNISKGRVIAIKLKPLENTPESKIHWIIGVNSRVYLDSKKEQWITITKSDNSKQKNILNKILDHGLKAYISKYKRGELYEIIDQRKINKLNYPLRLIQEVYSL